MSDAARVRLPWLFSAPIDLATFLGSAVVALALVAVGAQFGWLNGDTPEWTWVTAILLVDVAHVYATGFRVYFDTTEFRRRRWLYVLAPLLGYVIGVALYSEGESIFWRTLAYLAVFHFVRQQYGWVALYRARAGERDRWGRWIDSAAIYAATLYPLLYWHANLPRQYWWFLADDFAAIPPGIAASAAPVYWSILIAYAIRSVYAKIVLQQWNPGKDIVVVTTAVCWYVGIVALNSDYAFTVTNVLIHGVPYLVLVYWLRAETATTEGPRTRARLATAIQFLAVVWVLAFAEELLWDRSVWHERGWLFGSAWDIGRWKTAVIPLLALPQLTHYILDGFIWRRSSNPEFTLSTRDE